MVEPMVSMTKSKASVRGGGLLPVRNRANQIAVGKHRQQSSHSRIVLYLFDPSRTGDVGFDGLVGRWLTRAAKISPKV